MWEYILKLFNYHTQAEDNYGKEVLWSFQNVYHEKSSFHMGTVYSMEWSLGAELWRSIGVESNFGATKILIARADSVYLTFSNI